MLLALVVMAACKAREPEQVVPTTTTQTAIRTHNLATLGKIWGFAKYHHPRVTAGEIDWDEALLEVLPDVMGAEDREGALHVISDWIESAGWVPPCAVCTTMPDDAALPAPIDWIFDADALGFRLSGQLVHIYQNRPEDPGQHYVAPTPAVGNPRFINERSYADTPAPDEGLRLLGLYRFWNIIAYWFPYRDLMDDDLDDLLVEFIPEMLEASDGRSYRRAFVRLIARAKDTHANLWSDLDVRPPGGALGVPFAVRFVEDRAVIHAYRDGVLGPATGLQVGDVIVAIDGTPVEDLLVEWSPYYAASNQPTRLRDIARSLLDGETESVTLQVDRGPERFTATVSRVPLAELDRSADQVHDLSGPTFQRLSAEVAYLKLSSVVADSAVRYVERARGSEVLVIDIRNYPSEFVVFALGRHLVPRPTPFARFTSADVPNPGVFTMGPAVSVQPVAPLYEGRVVILVDETSQSQAEYTTMAFRVAPRAMVVGSTTAGADGNVSTIPLPGGLRSLISGIGVYYPDGSPTQRIGIVPDLVVALTIDGIREGRDEVLEAGVSAALGREFRLGG